MQTIPKTPRSAFSLTVGEGLLAFAVAGGAWWLLSLLFHIDRPADYAPRHIPAASWVFLMSNTLAASAICLRRFLWRDKTRTISRFGYAAFAGPIVQALALAFVVSGFFVLIPLGAAFIGHLIASLVVLIRDRSGDKKDEDCRGDFAALPLFFAWCLLLWLSQ